MRFLFLILVLSCSVPVMADSMLRISCAEQDNGGEIFLAPYEGYEGEQSYVYKGTCPIDVRVKPGEYFIEYRKTVDDTWYNWQATSVKVGDDVVQRVEMQPAIPRVSQTGVERYKQKELADNPWYTEALARIAPALKVFEQQGVTPGNGQTFRDCDTCPAMVIIPTTGIRNFGQGEHYLIDGTLLDAPDAATHNDWPYHSLTLFAFALSSHEVTLSEWRAVMGDATQAQARCDDCQVTNISWNEAKAYIKKLSAMTGKTYRLPSEAEWEYVCLEGNEYANKGNTCKSADATLDMNTRKLTVPPATGWGLYNMSAEAEMLEDCWHDTYLGAPERGEAWTGDGNFDKDRNLPGAKADCTTRVARGVFHKTNEDGSGTFSFSHSVRMRLEGLDARDNRTGFRVARDLY